MQRNSNHRVENLCAITCYFNPAKYRRRRLNYQTFRKNLNVPLVTVELSFDGEFELGDCDADILLRRRSESVLWQKERLLNVALEAVPGRYDRVAWLDCDLLFPESDWPEMAVRALDDDPLVQLFSRAHDIARDALPHLGDESSTLLSVPSIVSKVKSGLATAEDFKKCRTRLESRTSNGFAWGGRRELLERHGLYDGCIVGSGDRAIVAAAFGRYHEFVRAASLAPRHAAHYLDWAAGFFESVQGRVGCLDTDVLHLWHGEMSDRQSTTRHIDLGQFGFDPETDVAIDEQGCWCWTTDKRELIRFANDYFFARNEDGPEAAVTSPAAATMNSAE